MGVTFLVLETELANSDFIDRAPLGVCIYFDRNILETVEGLIFNSFASSRFESDFNSAD